jgi:hypothetical protein
MGERQAVILVSDDLLISLSGKLTALGIYTGDIAIQTTPAAVSQLAALFVIECDAADPFQSLTLEVLLPGEAEPRKLPYAVLRPPPPQGRTKLIYRVPFLLQNLRLMPGQIKARVIHERGSIDLSGPWVTLVGQAPMPSKN